MKPLPTQREWGCKMLLSKEVVAILQQHFVTHHISYMPVNGAYYCCVDRFESLPPSRHFELDFLVPEKQYDGVIDSFENLDGCKKVVSDDRKTLYSFAMGKSDIRFDVCKSVGCPNSTVYCSAIVNRGRRDGSQMMVLPLPEDLLLLHLCRVFNCIDLFFDTTTYNRISGVIKDPFFSWERFWHCAEEYGITRFASFILQKHEKQLNLQLPLPQRRPYSAILGSPRLNPLYALMPPLLRKVFYKVPFVKNGASYCAKKLVSIPRQKIGTFFNEQYIKIIRSISRPVVITAENTLFSTITQSTIEFTKEFTLPSPLHENFIISTTSGLWVLYKNKLHQISIGPSYGITRIGGRWFASQRLGTYSRIISFRISFINESPVLRDMKIVQNGLPVNLHQIDAYDDTVYISDTLNNRILYAHGSDKPGKAYPNKFIKSDVPAQKNNHFNSVFVADNFLYVLAHNGWLEKPRPSEVFVLNRNTMKHEDTIQLAAQDAHNLVKFRDELMYCDSKGGRLVRGDKDVFIDKNHFLRGLSITPTTIAVGGSEIIERSKRMNSNSILWFLDHDGNVKTSVELNKIGQIYEIRALDFDYGLSESWKNGH